MTVEDFFIVEDFTTAPAAEVATAAPVVEQGTLFDACTYAGPTNRRGVANVAMVDAFGNLAV